MIRVRIPGRGLHPPTPTPTPCPNHLPKALHPSAISLGVRVSVRIWGDTDIQAAAPVWPFALPEPYGGQGASPHLLEGSTFALAAPPFPVSAEGPRASVPGPLSPGLCPRPLPLCSDGRQEMMTLSSFKLSY